MIFKSEKKTTEEKARGLTLEADQSAQMIELELLKCTNTDQYKKLQKLEEEKKISMWLRRKWLLSWAVSP